MTGPAPTAAEEAVKVEAAHAKVLHLARGGHTTMEEADAIRVLLSSHTAQAAVIAAQAEEIARRKGELAVLREAYDRDMAWWSKLILAATTRATSAEAQVVALTEAAAALTASIDRVDPEQLHCSTVAYMNLRALTPNQGDDHAPA